MQTSETEKWASNVRRELRAEAMPVTLLPHQRQACDALSRDFLDEKKGVKAGLLVVPTGGGKTMIAAKWLLEHHVRAGGRVLWLAHRRSLLKQALGTFDRIRHVAYPREALRLIAISNVDCKWSQVEDEHDVVFSTMQTAVGPNNSDFVDWFVDQADKGVYVVVDEAHHAPAPGYSKLLRQLKERGCKLLGLTATPKRSNEEDQKRLSALFDKNVIYQISRRVLTERGILATPNFETIQTRVEVEKEFTRKDYEYLERFGDIGPDVLRRLAKSTPRNRLIVEQYLKGRDVYGPTIVFAAETIACELLAKEFRKQGVNADYVTYVRPAAQDVIERYRSGGLDVIVNVEMLTEGFDAPRTRTVFIARPTHSESLLSQMVGRALRGPKAGGNESAWLVTFLDTWRQFDVMDAEYVLGEAIDVEVSCTDEKGHVVKMPIPEELIAEAYRLVNSHIQVYLEGVFQSAASGWYIWEQEFEEDLQTRTVLVYDHQREGFEELRKHFARKTRIPEELTEDVCLALRQDYFRDLPDPLPRWTDIRDLLEAMRRGVEIQRYSFEERRKFDPTVLAKRINKEDMTARKREAYLRDVFEKVPGCKLIYRGLFEHLLEDVSREETKLSSVDPPVTREIQKIVPRGSVRAWPEDEPGYNLLDVRDAVAAHRHHFPSGAPRIDDLQWSDRPSARSWGFYRYSDRSVTLNRILNSPDIPLIVVEFVMYHELLHAEMPSAGHDSSFRLRERAFSPSEAALADAMRRGIPMGTTRGYWRVRADMFLDSFERRYEYKEPGVGMTL